MTTLDRLRPGQRAEVVSLSGPPGLVQRLYELGLAERVLVALAPLGDPLEIRVGYSRVTLRKSEAAGVTVLPAAEG